MFPLHPILAYHLKEWHAQTPYAKETDFVFPSLKAEGRVPISPAVFVADHLRPAAKAAGVQIENGQTIWAAQSPALAFQLACEQGEGRAQDRAEHPASFTHSDDAGYLHAGRWR